jgi:uncharacterized iron-regulated protein
MPYLMTNKAYILSIEQGFDALMEYHVVFVGEGHGSRVAHQAESMILAGLLERDSNLVLALEMFERDVQDILDGYLKGEMSEDEFLDRSRPWPEYQEDYRPLVEFAKSKGIPVIAANVPRRAAASVSMSNDISPGVLGSDVIYLPERLYSDSEEYHERFMATLGKMSSAGPMKRLNPEALYKAQVLKDAVMADSLRSFLDRRILFCCGHFHSDYHLGIPYQLGKNHPELNIAVITMASVVEPLPMKDRSRVADFIWIDE